MTAMKEFKEKVQAGEFFDALTLAMSEAVELKITTWVTSEDIDSSGSIDKSQPGNRLRTRINLIDGEIDNEIGSEFIDNPGYAELQKLHIEQVQQSRETMIRNLESLQAMFNIFNHTFSSTPEILPPQLKASERSALSPSQE